MQREAENLSIRQRLSTITKYFRKYRRYLVWGVLFITLSNVFILITPYIIKIIFDRLEAGAGSGVVLNWVLIMLGATLISGVFRFLVRRTIIWMSRYIEYDLRGELFGHLLKLSPSFYHNNRTGDLMAHATNDIEAVRMMIGPGVMHVVNTVVTLVVALGLMVYLSPTLTLWIVSPMIVFPFIVNKIGNLVHQRFARIQAFFSDLTATVQENLAGIRVVKAYGQESAEIDNMSDMSRHYVKLNLDLAKVQGVFFPLMSALASVLNVIILYVGGVGVLNGDVPLGTLVAFFAYTSMLYWPMFALGWVISLYQRGTASLDRINRILFTEPIIKNEYGDLHKEPMKGAIEFRNLQFGYNGTPVLQGINLKVESGQTIGVIGMTGSGKTTLVSLLARLFPVERGRLYIDGIDINDWNLESLRSQIGFATQEPFLFSETLADNIRFGTRDADLERITVAAETAAFMKDIDTFPSGLDTMVGERGITLSGGQKQRTAMARAIITDPAILILDDVTSAVDTQTEDEINNRIRQVLHGRTAIIISHRVSSVKNADVIIYLQDGRIAEEGSHEDLMRLNGHYAELYRSQLLEQELEAL